MELVPPATIRTCPTIQTVGLMIACMLPLVICVFVLRQMNCNEPDDQAVAELLIHELTTEDHSRCSRQMTPPARSTADFHNPTSIGDL